MLWEKSRAAISAGLTSIVFSVLTPTLASGVESKHALPTPAQQNAFDEQWQNARSFFKIGDFRKAALCYKKAADIPHHPEKGGQSYFIHLLGKLPLDPDAHIALGLFEMNGLDERYMLPQNNYVCGDGQAEMEFKAAITLSPNQKNDEAEALLTRLSEMRKKASIAPRHFGRLKELLNGWNPPSHDGVFITRLQVNFLSKAPEIIVPSPSKDHDETALIQLARCVMERKDEMWSPLLGGRHFAYVSGPDGNFVEDQPYGSVIMGEFFTMEEAKKSPEKNQLSKNYLEGLCTIERLTNYCRSDTIDAFKRGYYDESPRVIACGDLLPNCERLGPVKWIGCELQGKPITYEIQIGNSWRIFVDPQKVSSDSDPTEYFSRQRVHDVLFSALIDYQYANQKTTTSTEWLSRKPATNDPTEAFIRSSSREIAAFTCKLNDGRTVIAHLDPNQMISTVTVNGQLDTLWTKACQKRESQLRNR